MTRYSSMALGDRRQYLAVAIVSLVAIGFTDILSLSPGNFFQPYFRNIPPPLAVTIISILGVVSLGFLSSRRWFEMALGRESLRGVVWSSAFATLFAVVIIFADLVVVFPYQHVPPPHSVLFYPTMAYVRKSCFTFCLFRSSRHCMAGL